MVYVAIRKVISKCEFRIIFLHNSKKNSTFAAKISTTMPSSLYISQLSSVLFWDMDRDNIDIEKHSAGLIQRVLEYGTLQDWRITRDFYGMDRIVADCMRLRNLDPMALSFICAISNTNKEDYRCYHFKQSTPTHWNS